MNKHRYISGAAAAAVFALLGCDQKGDVNKQIEELKAAQQDSPHEAQKLEQDLDKAKSEVVRLEEKTALAKQGVTDQVLKEQEDVKQALGKEQKNVKDDVSEAQQKAQALNKDVTSAQRELEKVQGAKRVQAEVKTETQVVPSATRVEVQKQQTQVPIEQNRLVESKSAQPTGPSEARTTTTTGQAAVDEQTRLNDQAQINEQLRKNQQARSSEQERRAAH
jgi:hypothetical protein